jgi:hypothetical protein
VYVPLYFVRGSLRVVAAKVRLVRIAEYECLLIKWVFAVTVQSGLLCTGSLAMWR